MREELGIGTPMRAEKGQGSRQLDCNQYDACLDYAAKNGWSGFDCGSCEYVTRQAARQADGSKLQEMKTPALLCIECGEKERMGNSPYCARCMAIRGNKARAKNKDAEKPRKRKGTTALSKSKEAAREAITALTIEFGKHASILREIESLADEEIRPVECQVIYMLKEQLTKEKEVQTS